MEEEEEVVTQTVKEAGWAQRQWHVAAAPTVPKAALGRWGGCGGSGGGGGGGGGGDGSDDTTETETKATNNDRGASAGAAAGAVVGRRGVIASFHGGGCVVLSILVDRRLAMQMKIRVQ